jgi:hypothetical protein
MSIKGNGPFAEDVDPADYLDAVLGIHGECENNLQSCKRLNGGNGISNIAQMHPVDIIEIYPQVGGVFNKFIADLPKLPNLSLNFDLSSADIADPSNPSPKFR